MLYLFIFILGLFIGCLFGVIWFRNKNSGFLRVKNIDEDGPYLFLELHEDVQIMLKKKYVILKVDTIKCPSRK